MAVISSAGWSGFPDGGKYVILLTKKQNVLINTHIQSVKPASV